MEGKDCGEEVWCVWLRSGQAFEGEMDDDGKVKEEGLILFRSLIFESYKKVLTV